MEHKHGHDNHGHEGHHPLVPLKVYYLTLAALIVLTVVTVGVSYVDFGSVWNVVVSLTIASTKAALVMMFFMGLKYDNNLNRSYILSSFAGIILLVLISGIDMGSRPKPTPVTVKAMASALTEEQFLNLAKSTPDLVAKGKEVYDVNCAVCHGANGMGDGAGGAALNPKPRNFHADASTWTVGTSAKSIYVTLAFGVPGTGMASYKALPIEDRWALVHYLHDAFMKSVEKVGKSDARFAEAMKEDGIGAGGSGPKVSLPIEFAIDQVLQK